MPASKSTTRRRKSARNRSETEPETQPEARDETLFDQLENDAYVNVYRLNETTKKWDTQFRLAPSEVDPMYIQELRGGGTYKLVERVPTETGGTQYGRQRTITIDGPPKPLTKLPGSAAQEPGPNGASTPVRAGGVAMDDVMTAGLMQVFDGMQRAAEMQSAAVARMMERPQIDWGAIIVALGPILTKLLERPEQPNSLDQIEKVANILATQQKGAAGLGDTIDNIMAVFDLKERVMGEGGTGDPLLDLAAKNLPGLIDIIKTGTAQGQSPDQIRAAAAAAAGGDQPANPNPQVPMWQTLLAQWGPRLIEQAQKDVDPEASAKVLLGNIPAVFKGALRQFLDRPDAEAILYQSVPGLNDFRQWTEEFFNTIVLEFDPEAFDELPDEPQGEVGFVATGEPSEFASIPEAEAEDITDAEKEEGTGSD